MTLKQKSGDQLLRQMDAVIREAEFLDRKILSKLLEDIRSDMFDMFEIIVELAKSTTASEPTAVSVEDTINAGDLVEYVYLETPDVSRFLWICADPILLDLDEIERPPFDFPTCCLPIDGKIDHMSRRYRTSIAQYGRIFDYSPVVADIISIIEDGEFRDIRICGKTVPKHGRRSYREGDEEIFVIQIKYDVCELTRGSYRRFDAFNGCLVDLMGSGGGGDLSVTNFDVSEEWIASDTSRTSYRKDFLRAFLRDNSYSLEDGCLYDVYFYLPSEIYAEGWTVPRCFSYCFRYNDEFMQSLDLNKDGNDLVLPE